MSICTTATVMGAAFTRRLAATACRGRLCSIASLWPNGAARSRSRFGIVTPWSKAIRGAVLGDSLEQARRSLIEGVSGFDAD